MAIERNVDVFNRDVEEHGGYLYADQERYASRVANQRISEAIASCVDLAGKRVIDIGCGDGQFTRELALCGASEVLGIDGPKPMSSKPSPLISPITRIGIF